MNGSEQRLNTNIARLLAAMLVFTTHFLAAQSMRNDLWFACTIALGPQMFFAVSGYCLSARYRQLPSLKAFYRKRWFSVFPLFYLTFLLAYAAEVLRTGKPFYGGALWRLLFTLTASDMYVALYGVRSYALVGEWYTLILILLYLLFPLLRKLMEKRRRATGCVLVLLFSVDFMFRLFGVVPAASPTTALLSFWFGMLLQNELPLLQKHRLAAMGAALAVGVGACLLYPVFSFFYGLVLLLMASATVFLLLAFRSAPDRIAAGIGLLAEISYAFYLCHHYLIYRAYEFFGALSESVPGHILLYLLTLAAALVCAFCLTRLNQLLLRSLGARRAGRREKPPEAPGA